MGIFVANMAGVALNAAPLLAQKNDDGGGMAVLFAGLLCPLFMFAVAIVTLIGAVKVFSKAGQPGWAAIVPIYSTYVLVVEIAKKDMMWFILSLFIPFAIIVPLMDVAEKFGKEKIYGLGLAFLPFIFFPMLGFGSAKYRGGRSLDFDEDEDYEEDERPRKKKKKNYDDDYE